MLITIDFRTLAIINRVMSDKMMTWIAWISVLVFLGLAVFLIDRENTRKFPVPSGSIYTDTFFRDNNN